MVRPAPLSILQVAERKSETFIIAYEPEGSDNCSNFGNPECIPTTQIIK